MRKNAVRREQRPDPVADIRGSGTTEVPLDDPSFHYRIVNLEKDTEERVDYHRDIGYGVAKRTNRYTVMRCRKEEYEKRQAEAIARSDRFKEGSGEPSGDMVKDETTIEVSKGLSIDDD